MQTRIAWPSCDQGGGVPIDAFWVECDRSEAEVLIPQGEQLPEPGSPPGEPKTYCFLVARDQSFVLARAWQLPYSALWNAYNPFVRLPRSHLLKGLSDLLPIEIMYPDVNSAPSADSTGRARKGSQFWMQTLVEDHPEILQSALAPALRLRQGIDIIWHSPRTRDAYKEYRDGDSLRVAGIPSLPVRSLESFWPRVGPVWDAIGSTSDGESIFVEAKAHAAEVASPGTKAGEVSASRIRSSLAEARGFYAPESEADWSGTFYQYANRLAHHYLLHELNGLPSHLVFLYFVNARDMSGPASEAEWKSAIEVVHAALGLPHEMNDPYVHEIFVDVAGLRGPA